MSFFRKEKDAVSFALLAQAEAHRAAAEKCLSDADRNLEKSQAALDSAKGCFAFAAVWSGLAAALWLVSLFLYLKKRK
jgi:hypothetical protein